MGDKLIITRILNLMVFHFQRAEAFSFSQQYFDAQFNTAVK